MLYPRGYGPVRLLLAVNLFYFSGVFIPDPGNHMLVHVPAWAAVGSGVYRDRFHVNFFIRPFAAILGDVRLSPP